MLPADASLCLSPARFSVALRLRLWLPIPVGLTHCPGCHARLDAYGVHLLACTRTGRLQRRAKHHERAWKRVLEEAGATRVVFQPLVRSLGVFGIAPNDTRRLDVAAYGLPDRDLPLLIDCTLRTPLTGQGVPRGGAASIPGSTFSAAYGAKFNEYRAIAESGQCQFLVLAAEVFGRFDDPSRRLVASLARAKVQSLRPILRRRMELVWHRRFWGFLSTAVQAAVADCLLPQYLQNGVGSSSRRRPRHGGCPEHATVLELDHEAPEVSRLPPR